MTTPTTILSSSAQSAVVQTIAEVLNVSSGAVEFLGYSDPNVFTRSTIDMLDYPAARSESELFDLMAVRLDTAMQDGSLLRIFREASQACACELLASYPTAVRSFNTGTMYYPTAAPTKAPPPPGLSARSRLSILAMTATVGAFLLISLTFVLCLRYHKRHEISAIQPAEAAEMEQEEDVAAAPHSNGGNMIFIAEVIPVLDDVEQAGKIDAAPPTSPRVTVPVDVGSILGLYTAALTERAAVPTKNLEQV